MRKDPGFARAYSGLADSYAYLAFFRQMPSEAAYRLANEAIQRALVLDDSIGETHDTLGVLNWRYKWDWEAAEREMNEAIARAPSYSCAHEDRAEYLAFRGRRAEARAEMAKVTELDPSIASVMTESGVDYQLRDFEGLIQVSRKGVALNPNEWLEHFFLGFGYEGTGKQMEAVLEFERAVELSSGDQDATAALADAYVAVAGRLKRETFSEGWSRNPKRRMCRLTFWRRCMPH